MQAGFHVRRFCKWWWSLLSLRKGINITNKWNPLLSVCAMKFNKLDSVRHVAGDKISPKLIGVHENKSISAGKGHIPGTCPCNISNAIICPLSSLLAHATLPLNLPSKGPFKRFQHLLQHAFNAVVEPNVGVV